MENEVQVKVEKVFRKKIQRDKNIQNAFLLIHSEKYGIHLKLAEGSTERASLHPDHPYFIASIDKLFTSVLIARLVEEGKLSFEDFLVSYLDADLLHELHMYKGTNYTDEIKIKHLLNHTSGLFGDALERSKQGVSMFDLLLNESPQLRTPKVIIQWSKENLNCQFPPGKGYYYSDFGYYLLILLIEKIHSKPYREILNNTLFGPLGMENTYMLPLSNSIDVAPCYLNGLNVAANINLGMDTLGGRIVSTTEDLLKFMKALVRYEILHQDTLEQMKDWAKFSIGIDYGYGIMSFKPIPLFMPKKYCVWGNAGSNGSFMFYHPEMDTYFIGSFNDFRYQRKGIVFMFKMIDILHRYFNNIQKNNRSSNAKIDSTLK